MVSTVGRLLRFPNEARPVPEGDRAAAPTACSHGLLRGTCVPPLPVQQRRDGDDHRRDLASDRRRGRHAPRCACRGCGRSQRRLVGSAVVRDNAGWRHELSGWLVLRDARASRGGRDRHLWRRPGTPPCRAGWRWSRLIARTAKNGVGMASRTSRRNRSRWAALSGRARGHAKSGTGPVEGLRALLVAKRSARSIRISTGQLRHLVITAPDDLRVQLAGLTTKAWSAAAALRPRLATTGPSSPRPRPHACSPCATLTPRSPRSIVNSRGSCERPRLSCSRCTGSVSNRRDLLVTAGDNAARIRNEAAWAHLCGVAPIPAGSGKINTVAPQLWRDRQANQRCGGSCSPG